MRRRDVIAGLAVLAPFAARAQASFSNAKALSGARFVSGEQEFLLADVIAPPLYTLTKEAPPHFEASRGVLAALLPGAVELIDALPPTRWGVRRVIAKNAGGDALQELLISAGAVRVQPQSEDHEFIERLLTLEAEARADRRGLWALPDYRVFSADRAYGAIGEFHLIEGKVASAEKHGARLYLNFGEDYRTDFTAGAANALNSKWLKAGTDLTALQDAKIRIRGFIEAINGPSVDLKHPLQIERIG